MSESKSVKTNATDRSRALRSALSSSKVIVKATSGQKRAANAAKPKR